MELHELEQTLETTLALTRPSAREVRDGLVDYYATIARPFVLKGLAFTDPRADEALLRRILLARIGVLWRGSSSPWDKPSIEDLRRFRQRIEQFACVKQAPGIDRVKELLDHLFLSASVAERLETSRKRPRVRRFQLIQGGGNISPPTGKLRLLKPAQDSTSTTI